MPLQIDTYEASGLEALGILSFYLGFVVTLVGLWLSVGGLRVVVSGRIDERKRSAGSLKRGLPILIIGLVLLFGASWLISLRP